MTWNLFLFQNWVSVWLHVIVKATFSCYLWLFCAPLYLDWTYFLCYLVSSATTSSCAWLNTLLMSFFTRSCMWWSCNRTLITARLCSQQFQSSCLLTLCSASVSVMWPKAVCVTQKSSLRKTKARAPPQVIWNSFHNTGDDYFDMIAWNIGYLICFLKWEC